MTLQQLHYAIVISETGSMNKAAERLYIAQPSLTGAMQELERELGITIFHRSGRGVTLTNDGQEFIDYARQVYHQYETLAEKYAHPNELKKKFGVTTQHYSFAVKAFVEMAKSFDTAKYDFAIRESKTHELRHRAPPVHHPRFRFDPGHARGRHCRAGHPRRADRSRRVLCRFVQQSV